MANLKIQYTYVAILKKYSQGFTLVKTFYWSNQTQRMNNRPILLYMKKWSITLGKKTTRRMTVAVDTRPAHTAMSSQWFPYSSEKNVKLQIKTFAVLTQAPLGQNTVLCSCPVKFA